jgi:prepilin-type N-terminal cleavage/methylation domain-containing protein/prepilin-type processing-associated H-X9-DG protein
MPLNRRGMSLIELLVVIAIISILIGLTLAGVQKVRASAAKVQCGNQLRQLALGLQQYHDANNRFPAGTSVYEGKSSQPFVSWLTRILPHVEQDALWRQTLAAFQSDKRFSNPPHTPISGRNITVFMCPADSHARTLFPYANSVFGYTSYLGVNGTDYNYWNGILHEDSEVKIAEIRDGTSNTLLVGERSVGRKVPKLGWWYAGVGQNRSGSLDHHLGVREINNYDDLSACFHGPYQYRAGSTSEACDAFRFWSHHTGGAHFAFADGSVKFMAYSANEVMPALATKAGNETLPEY